MHVETDAYTGSVVYYTSSDWIPLRDLEWRYYENNQVRLTYLCDGSSEELRFEFSEGINVVIVDWSNSRGPISDARIIWDGGGFSDDEGDPSDTVRLIEDKQLNYLWILDSASLIERVRLSRRMLVEFAWWNQGPVRVEIPLTNSDTGIGTCIAKCSALE